MFTDQKVIIEDAAARHEQCWEWGDPGCARAVLAQGDGGDQDHVHHRPQETGAAPGQDQEDHEAGRGETD